MEKAAGSGSKNNLWHKQPDLRKESYNRKLWTAKMKKIWNICKMSLALLLFWCGLRLAGQAKTGADILTVFLDETTLTEKQAEEICKKEAERESPVSACFWHENKKITAFCRETGQACFLTELTVTGDPNLVIPGSSVLSWQTRGCMLDTASSEELFGTGDACGQTVRCGEESYIVCGTFESLQKILIRKADNGSACPDCISLRIPGNKNRKEEAAQFLMRYSLSGDCADLQTLAILAGDLCLLCPALAAHALFRELYRRRKRGSHIAAVILAAVTIWFLWNRMQIPADMIPSKWSDLSFWKIWSDEQRRNLLLLFGSALGEGYLSVLCALAGSCISSLSAVFLMERWSAKK